LILISAMVLVTSAVGQAGQAVFQLICNRRLVWAVNRLGSR